MKKKILKFLLSVAVIGSLVLSSNLVAFAEVGASKAPEKEKVTITLVHRFCDGTVIDTSAGKVFDGKVVTTETETLTFNKGESVKIYASKTVPTEVPAGYEDYTFAWHGANSYFLKPYFGYVEGVVNRNETITFTYRKAYNPVNCWVQMGTKDADGNFVKDGEAKKVGTALDVGEFPETLTFNPAVSYKMVREFTGFSFTFDYDHDKYQVYGIEGKNNGQTFDLGEADAVLSDEGVLTGVNTNNVDFTKGGKTDYTLYLVPKDVPQEEPIEDPKDDPTEEPKDNPKDEPKEEVKTVEKTDTPKTGDDLQLFTWIILLVTTTGCAAAVAAYKKEK